MKRREFIGLVGVGSVVASCSHKTTQSTLPASSSRADGFQLAGTVSELDKNGQISNKELSAGAVLIVRDPDNASQLTAVNPTCTHAGCTVAWQQDWEAFVCPCHDSQFASDGKVLQGPAEQPLAAYAVKIEGNDILVKTG
ncbi:MAG: ubiquinol-cytochrome c reductase iron-sulfur subunit [Hydrococcus sp. Prado102]|jgi:cytochrome b6-f complex iron-sulfur subunit|nr:ubiquinol-cytochrome c reductase iron-sulfur subunit [Hydrococcus sp. Prado102]